MKASACSTCKEAFKLFQNVSWTQFFAWFYGYLSSSNHHTWVYTRNSNRLKYVLFVRQRNILNLSKRYLAFLFNYDTIVSKWSRTPKLNDKNLLKSWRDDAVKLLSTIHVLNSRLTLVKFYVRCIFHDFKKLTFVA